MHHLPLETPLSALSGIGSRFLKHLERLGLRTVRDLVWHFPARYEDYSQMYRIADLEPGQHATIQGTVRGFESRRTWQRRMTIVEAVVEDDSGSIRAVWFNQPYVIKNLPPNRMLNFSGKVAVSSEGEPYLAHPTYEFANGGSRITKQTRHTARLVPIYPETRGFTSKGLRFLIQPILEQMERIPEFLPLEVLKTARLPEATSALRNIHFPDRIEDAFAAKRRFAFEDLFLLQLVNVNQKLKLARVQAPFISLNLSRLKEVIARLPFTLTFTQKKSLWEILKDIKKSQPMNRLLQGDVGSGKTVVAALAALLVAENGFQTAFLAPTEVLALQHYETLKKLFSRISVTLQPTLSLLTSSEAKLFFETDVETTEKKSRILGKIKSGKIALAVGTHALIQKSVVFRKLGLIIIDEQHRFGVQQRARLSRGQTLVPHFLSMSATPIPRTLMLTVFGDLDVSTITELPKGRKSIITKIVAPENRDKAYEFIRQQIRKGRQAFVICPRIEPSANNELAAKSRMDKFRILELKSVKEEYEKLSKKVFPDLRVIMLHGQLKAKEKGRIMDDFRAGRTDILVSTSVVEVGVDVPNATIMMIEGAERFGLSQLYQFRGRVGRGGHQSFCLLFTDSDAKTAERRLKAIVEAKNGFELAEMDLKIRGPGEFLGQKQTGLPDIVMEGLRDPELIRESRGAAQKTLERDPGLHAHPQLKQKLEAFQMRIHLE